MDIFVVLAEWIDLGLGGLGIFGGLVLYRRRHLLREALWWWTTQNRLRWLQIYLDAAPSKNPESADGVIRTLRRMGHPLNKAESDYASNYLNGKIRNETKRGG